MLTSGLLNLADILFRTCVLGTKISCFTVKDFVGIFIRRKYTFVSVMFETIERYNSDLLPFFQKLYIYWRNDLKPVFLRHQDSL